MSIESIRAAAIRAMNLGTWLGGDEIVCKACKERLSFCHCDISSNVERTAREVGEARPDLSWRDKSPEQLNHNHTSHGGSIIDADLVVGDVLRVVKIDHVDGPIFRLERRSYGLPTPKWSQA